MVNIDKYLQETSHGVSVCRTDIVSDICEGKLGYIDIAELSADDRISGEFFTSKKKYMLDDDSQINDAYVNKLCNMAVAEEFNLTFLLYVKSASDKAKINKKTRRANTVKYAITFAGGIAAGIGGMVIGRKVNWGRR